MYMVSVNSSRCDGGGTCVSTCPQSVFKVEGIKPETMNILECVNYLTCVESCPQRAITVSEI